MELYNKAQLDAIGTLVGQRIKAAIAALTSIYAPLSSPALTGTPTAPTPGGGAGDTEIATVGYVAANSGGGGGGGWEFVDELYDSSSHGVVRVIDAPTFASGYDYLVAIDRVDHNGGSTNAALQCSFVTDIPASSPFITCSHLSNSARSMELEFRHPAFTRSVKHALAHSFDSWATTAIAPTVRALMYSWPPGVALINVRFQFSGGFSFNVGSIRIYRRAITEV